LSKGDFWIIVALGGSEDETEIRAGVGRTGGEGYSPGDAATLLGRRHRAGGFARRRQHRRENLYYRWSKEFLEAGKKRLAGDTAREASSDEVKQLRAEARQLKEALAEATLENRLLKKSVIADGEDIA
jgi:transposase